MKDLQVEDKFKISYMLQILYRYSIRKTNKNIKTKKEENIFKYLQEIKYE